MLRRHPPLQGTARSLTVTKILQGHTEQLKLGNKKSKITAKVGGSLVNVGKDREMGRGKCCLRSTYLQRCRCVSRKKKPMYSRWYTNPRSASAID